MDSIHQNNEANNSTGHTQTEYSPEYVHSIQTALTQACNILEAHNLAADFTTAALTQLNSEAVCDLTTLPFVYYRFSEFTPDHDELTPDGRCWISTSNEAYIRNPSFNPPFISWSLKPLYMKLSYEDVWAPCDALPLPNFPWLTGSYTRPT